MTERAHLPEIAYKPGWSFTWHMNTDGPPYTDGPPLLLISCEEPCKALDSVTGEWRGPYHAYYIVPMPFDPQWLLELLADIEDHERREWIRVNGDRVCNPHVMGEPYAMAANRSEWPNARSRAVKAAEEEH